MTEQVDVVVVGAGPTGLTVAGDLAAAGVRVTVLERHDGSSSLSRAFGVHARTLEELDMRGLADELVASGARVDRLRLFDQVQLDLTGLPSRFPYLLVTPQYRVEQLLERRAVRSGATVLRGVEVTTVDQDADGVEVGAHTAGGAQTFRARYVVGADGVHSAVRRSLGLPFPGVSVLRSIMLADVRLTETPPEALTVNAVGDGFALVAPFGDGWYRVFAWDRRHQAPDDAPLELEELREVTRRALGTDFGMHDPRWMSRFHSDERQAPTYRVGRVLLAGDAAHVHSPAGGQGMNTGIQDAANLGWKLAAVVRGTASDPLLDTYQAERHPVGRMVLRSSGALIRMAMLRARPARTVRNLLLGGLLRVPPVARRAVGSITGLGIGYHRRGDGPLVGTRVPDLPLRDGGRLFEALRPGRFLLVLPEGAAAAPRRLPAEVTAVTAAGTEQPGPAALRALLARNGGLLVRPDGYVAWAGGPEQVADGSWRAGLTRWLDLSGAAGPAPLAAVGGTGSGARAAGGVTPGGGDRSAG
jgi:2-polyprenyl-6-methoxyphenol hydroxylase-like FAD-dependent oxidoreductase